MCSFEHTNAYLEVSTWNYLKQLPEAIWRYQELLGDTWSDLMLSSEAIWSYLELSEAFWSYLGYLELYGATWSYPELSGAILRYLELSGTDRLPVLWLTPGSLTSGHPHSVNPCCQILATTFCFQS